LQNAPAAACVPRQLGQRRPDGKLGSRGRQQHLRENTMNFRSIIAAAAVLTTHPAVAEDDRFEADPVASVRENFVACEVPSQLQRVMENPRFLLASECVPLRAGERVRVYASRRPYACIYPHGHVAPCKWTHQNVLSKRARRTTKRRARAGGSKMKLGKIARCY